MSLCRSIPSFFEQSSSERPQGFTLIEVLIAISIFAIAISSIYGVFTSISATKDKLDRNSETYHQARVILDRIGREIHGVYVHNGSDTNILRGGLNEKGELFFELSTTAASSLNINGTRFVAVRYELVEDRESKDSRYVILRTEKPLWGSLSGQDFPAMRMATGIKNFRIRFLSEKTWQNQWDEKLQGFPDMLEVLLTAYDKEGEEISFLTAFKFPVAGSQ
ncbi:MAG: prepilin-type N-terminal cleavage/methylation domain-containing protein [Desulfuromusa sp.]|jgi:general secretion pathway protein J|nr:prepilin-type N-terminal cleavage/methylation domain-containing protein [Desulfuromusa sp.]